MTTQKSTNISNFNFVVKLTTNCPANCKCCSNRKKEIFRKKENNKIFSISNFDKLCKAIKNAGGSYVCLSGGEPTIVNSINDYFKIAYSYGLSTRINTNGWNITEENLSNWISLGLNQIVLSIYSLNSNITRDIRGNESLQYRALNAANLIGKFRNNNNFEFIIQTVIMRNNYHEMADILELAINNNSDYFWPSYLEDAINLSEIRMEEEHILDFRNKIIPKMKSVIKKYSRIYNYNIDTLFNSIDKLYSNSYKNYIYHDNYFQCNWLGKHLTFYPNGFVYPCPGHEYFSSKYQIKLDYSKMDNCAIEQILNKNKMLNINNCKYCPQGVFQDINLTIHN